jgi:hypothetical protein
MTVMSRWAPILSLLLVLAAGACAPTTARLSDGRLTSLTGDRLRVRDSLETIPRSSPGSPRYRSGVACRFTRMASDPDGSMRETAYALTVTEVVLQAGRPAERLLITMTSPSGPSTALIGLQGELFDFNAIDERTSTRVNPDTYDAHAGTVLRDAGARGPGAHVLNEWSVFFPDFTGRRWIPGEVAAVIRDERGQIWGRYVYRGVLRADAPRDYAVFDIMRVFETAPQAGPVVVGYSLFDPVRMTPLQVELEMGYLLKFQRRTCDA